MTSKATLIPLALFSFLSVALTATGQPPSSTKNTVTIGTARFDCVRQDGAACSLEGQIAKKGRPDDHPKPDADCDDHGSDVCALFEQVAKKSRRDDHPKPETDCDDRGTDVCLDTAQAAPLLARERGEAPRGRDNERAGDRQRGRRS